MTSNLASIVLRADHTDHDWREACGKAYERLKLDPRCNEESIRVPELVGGDPYQVTWQVTADTKGGDVLRVFIKIYPKGPVHRRRNVV